MTANKTQLFRLIPLLLGGFLLLHLGACTHASAGKAAADPRFPWEHRPTTLDSTEKKIASRLDSVFYAKVKTTGLNACMLVARHGKIIYENVNGWQNYDKKKLLTLHSTFQLASSSKPITATAVLQLMEQGKFQLTDTFAHFFPDFPYKDITIHDLLCHRTGLPDYTESEEWNDFKPAAGGKYVSNQDLFNFLVKSPIKRFSPANRAFDYSNTNYALLALLVEKMSGQTFRDYLHDHIFVPAHMDESYVCNRYGDTIHANETVSYFAYADFQRTPELPADGIVGDKGTFSTVEDMYKFDRALANGILLKKETLAMAYTGTSNELPGRKNYGLGWRLIRNNGFDDVVYHNGWWRGYTNTFCRRPSDDIVIIILCNKYNRGAWDITAVWSALDRQTATVKNGDVKGER